MKVLDIHCAERRVDLNKAYRGLIETPFQLTTFPVVTRQERINDFDHQGMPPADRPLQILCEDHVGTYVIPFLCRWHDAAWQSVATNRPIEATVIGWRAPRQTQR
jgi:hypothetical protein